jgi:putative transcriptional regulator
MVARVRQITVAGMPLRTARLRPATVRRRRNRQFLSGPDNLMDLTNGAGITTDASGAILQSPKSRPGAPVVVRPSGRDIDVKRIRLTSRGIEATQRSFAAAIGVPVKTVSNWEQGRRKPTGPALVLLSLIQRDPWIVFDVANGQHKAV